MGFILTMDKAHKIANRWRGAGDVVMWVIYFFWALWVFDALLPPKPEQTPFESYFGRQMGQRPSGKASAQPWSSEAMDQADRRAAE